MKSILISLFINFLLFSSVFLFLEYNKYIYFVNINNSTKPSAPTGTQKKTHKMTGFTNAGFENDEPVKVNIIYFFYFN